MEENILLLISTIAGIIGAIAAIIAAYYSFKSRPKKVKNLDVKVKTVIKENSSWQVTIEVTNNDEVDALNPVIAINIPKELNFKKVVPYKSVTGGLIKLPNITEAEDYISYSPNKIISNTISKFKIQLEGQEGEYKLRWKTSGSNIANNVSGETDLILDNN